MGGYGDVKLLNDDGSRLDGRTFDESRPVEVKAGVIPVADGSAWVKHGLNEVVCAVYGPMEAHPRKIQLQDKQSSMCATTWLHFRLPIVSGLDSIAVAEKSARLRQKPLLLL